MKKLVSAAAVLALCSSVAFASAAELRVNDFEFNDSVAADSGAEPEKIIFTVDAKDFPAVTSQQYELVLPAELNEQIVSADGAVLRCGGAEHTLIAGADFSYDKSGGVLKFTNLPETSGDYTLSVEVSAADELTLGTYDIKVQNVTATGAGGAGVEVQTVPGKLDINSSTWHYKNSSSENQVNTNFIKDGEPAFVPYGSVWQTSNKFIDKDSKGRFKIGGREAAFVTKFRLPSEGRKLVTFGVSENTDGTLQFGSYVPQTAENAEYGTLVVHGDYAALREYAAGKTDDEILSRLAALYDESAGGNAAVRVKFGERSVDVYMVKQSNYMWHSGTGAGAALQYALKINNLSGKADLFTAAGYEKTAGSYSFTGEIQTASYPAADIETE